MLSRRLTAAAVLLGLSAAGPVQAQVSSEGMEDISAWGVRYLSSSEPDFPSSLWTGSDEALLLELLVSLDTSSLTTSERSLLRRVVLSPATPITGPNSDAILTERARLMLELGEAGAAAALAPRLEPGALGLEAEALAIDLELAAGQEATACGRLSRPVSESVYWMQLRAVCAVLRENFSGAELAIEVASARGLDDPWFLEAVFAASGDVPDPPPAKYDSGLSIALSLKADLDTSMLDTRATRPDLAAVIARRKDIEVPLRVRFGEIAYLRSLISSQEWRDILEAQFEDPEFEPTLPRDQALAILLDPLASDEEKASILAEELVDASDGRLKRFERAVNLYAPDLGSLARSYVTLPYADLFARAAFANGEIEDARAWLDLANPPPGPETDPLTEDAAASPEDAEEPGTEPDGADAETDEAGEPDIPVATRGPMRLTQPAADDAAQTDEEAPEAGAPDEVGTTPEASEAGTEVSVSPEGVTIDGVTLPIDVEDTTPEPVEAYTESFLRVLIDALALMSGDSDAGELKAALTGRLIAAAETERELEQTTLMLTLLPSFGIRLDADARAFLISQPIAGDPVDPHILVAIETATEDYAFAEAALMMLTQLRDDPQMVAGPDLARFLAALSEMRARDIAAGFAREASGFWTLETSAIMAE